MALYGSPIADFLNRIQLHFSGDLLSSVGLANEIAGFSSEVSTRDIIATYPYPNTLVVCEITGKQLKNVMERSAEYFAYDKEGNVCVSDSFLIPKVEHYNYDYYMGVDFMILTLAMISSTTKQFAAIEKEMKKVCKEGKKIYRREISKAEAMEMFKDDPYKLDLEGLEDGNISVYDQGDFTDLCRGPHVDNTKLCKNFKLVKYSGVYWKGDANNHVMQRIYGVCFPTPEELEEHLKLL